MGFCFVFKPLKKISTESFNLTASISTKVNDFSSKYWVKKTQPRYFHFVRGPPVLSIVLMLVIFYCLVLFSIAGEGWSQFQQSSRGRDTPWAVSLYVQDHVYIKEQRHSR